MPLPNSNFYACFPLQESILDKLTGSPLTGGSITFFRDSARTVPKNVYQQVQMPDNSYEFVDIGNVVNLGGAGSPVDVNGVDFVPFLYPFENPPSNDNTGAIDLYYIEVESATSLLQFTREAWPPNVGTGTSPTDTFESSDNQISNSQFIEISFVPASTVFSVSGSNIKTNIAPNWDLITIGTGTVTVKQIAPVDTTIPSNPPFVLDINSTGITSLILRQTLLESPRLFANGFVSASFVAASQDSAEHVLLMKYVPSNGDQYTLLSATTTADNQFQEFINTTPINGTINTDPATTGFLNIDIVIPVTTNVRISSVQIVSVQNASSETPYLQQSADRQTDYLFHYYKPLLKAKRVPSFLVGWDFPLNPAQILASNVPVQSVGANKSFYVWDKTICFQTVNSGIAFARNNLTLGLECIPASNTSFAIIQYIPVNELTELFTGRQSIKLSAQCGSGTVNGTVSLYWTTDASVSTLPDSLVASILSGVPTVGGGGVHGNWNVVARNKLTNTPAFTLNTTLSEYDFIGFDTSATSAKTTANFAAIVICFDTVNAGNTVSIEYCTLNTGDIPTAPSPQTADQVLRECEREYEQTYPAGSKLNDPISNGSVIVSMINSQPITPGAITLHAKNFSYEWKTEKRVSSPILRFNTVAGTTLNAGNAGGVIFNGGTSIATTNISMTNAANFTRTLSSKNCIFNATNVAALVTSGSVSSNFPDAFLQFHLVIDARLGVV